MINKPYKRTCRIFSDGSYANSGKSEYIKHPLFAQSPTQYIRAYQVLQKDLISLFDYIEPSDQNLETHSFRIQELLMRFCVEIEANCTAILKENGYSVSGRNLNMCDYKKIEQSHYLSKYKVMLPNWYGEKGTRTPFSAWSNGSGLDWYQVYNTTKHDRHSNFHKATFDVLIDAACGLCALLAAQFWTYSFTQSDNIITTSSGDRDGYQSAIGDYFRVKFPTDVPRDQVYDFSFASIDFHSDIFNKFSYK
ncbi:hypothetical protein M2G59_21050 [Vibrio vulnificus]|nr:MULTISPECIES: hypothetical protein [Vibrio]EJG1067261.1 hypothetical protein [Vibrio parahaemolyticus O1]AMG12349.1 hypothetical protein AL549_13570 [Vibrio vulnificus]EGR0237756.1 hypothetical protein [Vibrio vulnificus]EJG2373329.1 hypothetical protein [Vibrio parahaemolyticus]EJO9912884.1 hypothetical protein [Vibrio parahaemolyticus]